MPLRKDLTFERSGTEVPYLYTDAKDIDEALRKATFALRDAQSFREYAKATGTDVVKKEFDWSWAAICFVFGVCCCLLVLISLGVI